MPSHGLVRVTEATGLRADALQILLCDDLGYRRCERMKDMAEDRYVRPGWLTKHLFNGLVAAATRAGLSVWGSRVLRVRGRTSGEWRETPVNLLTYEGSRYLVAPRGVTQWVRNLRVAGEGELKLGRHVERFRATEIADQAKVDILRAYLRRWKAEVGVFFEGVGAGSPEDDVKRIAPNHPVFLIEPREPGTGGTPRDADTGWPP